LPTAALGVGGNPSMSPGIERKVKPPDVTV
jgi:hypothetical protein